MSEKGEKKDLPDPFKKFFHRMMDKFAEYQWERLLASHFLQSPQEKKARLRNVMELSVELASVKGQLKFATAFGESAIEAVIEGEWKRVADHIDWLSFNDDPSTKERYGEAWRKFREILHAACVEARHRQELALKDPTGGN